MILLNKKMKTSEVFLSDYGRVVACKTQVGEQCVGVVNVYAPNSGNYCQLWIGTPLSYFGGTGILREMKKWLPPSGKKT